MKREDRDGSTHDAETSLPFGSVLTYRLSRTRYTRDHQNATIGRMPEAPQHPTTGPAAPLNLDDFEPAAQALLAPAIYDYIAGGAAEHATLRDNRDAYP